jgi:hypothetical protein
MIRTRVLLLVAFVALTACSSKKTLTQVVLVVDSDLRVPDQLSGVRVEVKLDDMSVMDHSYDLTGDIALPYAIPVQAQTDTHARIEFDVRAIGPAPGPTLFTRTAITHFIEGKDLRLYVFLAASCVNTTCNSGDTCTPIGCGTPEINEETLPEVQPGHELDNLPDAGMTLTDGGNASDSGSMGTDATPGDASGGSDASPQPDSSPSDAVAMDASGTDASPGMDASQPTDASPGMDAARTDATPMDGSVNTTCSTSASCGTGYCLDFTRVDPNQGYNCTGGNGCRCYASCDPFAVTSGCVGNYDCIWWDTTPTLGTRGACINAASGGTQGQACSVTVNAQDQVNSDTCNEASNYRCVGINPPAKLTGTCGRICDANEAGLCSALGGYACNPFTPPFGFCENPPMPYTDIGAACTMGGNCMSGFCFTPSGSCSAHCPGDLDVCPIGSACLTNALAGKICIKQCPHGDSDCRPPATVCTNIGTAAQPFDICSAGCGTVGCQGGMTCTSSTGHCH